MSIYFYASSCIAMWMLLSVLDRPATQTAFETAVLVFLWPFIWPVYVISALLDNAPS